VDFLRSQPAIPWERNADFDFFYIPLLVLLTYEDPSSENYDALRNTFGPLLFTWEKFQQWRQSYNSQKLVPLFDRATGCDATTQNLERLTTNTCEAVGLENDASTYQRCSDGSVESRTRGDGPSYPTLTGEVPHIGAFVATGNPGIMLGSVGSMDTHVQDIQGIQEVMHF
jgi:hypothetical protein